MHSGLGLPRPLGLRPGWLTKSHVEKRLPGGGAVVEGRCPDRSVPTVSGGLCLSSWVPLGRAAQAELHTPAGASGSSVGHPFGQEMGQASSRGPSPPSPCLQSITQFSWFCFSAGPPPPLLIQSPNTQSASLSKCTYHVAPLPLTSAWLASQHHRLGA